jgi:hypothetical protein
MNPGLGVSGTGNLDDVSQVRLSIRVRLTLIDLKA